VARAAWARLVAGAALVVALLAAHIASLGHLALVRHVRCEHGALVHAAHDDAPAAGSATRPERGVAVTTSAARDHDHCDALALRPALVEAGPRLDDAALLPALEPPCPGHQRTAFRPVGVLSLAPKSSPPV
jgi:hypothetical protein